MAPLTLSYPDLDREVVSTQNLEGTLVDLFRHKSNLWFFFERTMSHRKRFAHSSPVTLRRYDLDDGSRVYSLGYDSPKTKVWGSDIDSVLGSTTDPKRCDGRFGVLADWVLLYDHDYTNGRTETAAYLDRIHREIAPDHWQELEGHMPQFCNSLARGMRRYDQSGHYIGKVGGGVSMEPWILWYVSPDGNRSYIAAPTSSLPEYLLSASSPESNTLFGLALLKLMSTARLPSMGRLPGSQNAQVIGSAQAPFALSLARNKIMSEARIIGEVEGLLE